jgi:hypothetical protein
MISVTIEGRALVIRLPMLDEFRLSESGKTKIIATNAHNKNPSLAINDEGRLKSVMVEVVAYVTREET